MRQIIRSLQKSQALLLFLLPMLHLFFGAYFRTLLGDLSLRSIDPDYIYFSNGLGVSLGSFDTGNIFHPGSPLQYFIAGVFRLTYLLRSPETTYLEDLFSHPDLYLSVVSFCVIGLISLVLFASGLYIFRLTKSILYGLLIQTSVFLPIIWYDLIGRVTPEAFQAFSVLALIVITVKYYWEDKLVASIYDVILFALIVAFGLSTKITFIPLALIPLFILDNWKKIILFLTLTFILFLTISWSVLLKIEFFWGWVKNIFIHSGDYGAGNSNVVDFNSFKTNFLSFVQLEKWYFMVVALSFLVLLLYLIVYRKKSDRRLVVFSLSVLIAVALHLAIVCKHFAHRNFVPSLLLLPLVVFFAIEVFKRIGTNKILKPLAQLVLIVFLIVTLKNQFVWLPIKSTAMENDINARKETQDFASTLSKNSVVILTTQSYGCPFIEYALMYSTVWSSHDLKPKLAETLAKIYPNTYQHTTWDDRFQYWGEKFNVQKVIDSGKPIYLYLERNEEEIYNKTISKLSEENGSPIQVNRELIYLNPKTSEIIYQLTFSYDEKNKAE